MMERQRDHATGLAWAVALGALAVALIHSPGVLAQGAPFGVGPPRTAPPPVTPPPDGLVGWILAKQAEFYRGLTAALRAARADGSALWGLIALSAAYGVFHAAGPGHGKAVISAYLIADNQTWRRGVVLSFVSALVQALAAIAVVGTVFALIGATARTLDQTIRWVEIAAFATIALIGARLLWIKGRALVATLRAAGGTVSLAGAGGPVIHIHADGQACDGSCGHAHGPPPELLAGAGGWRRGLTAVIAVGMRPCTGAIVVLTFALMQGMIWTGIAATFAMAVGTALTVAAIATMAVCTKDIAVRLAGVRPGWPTILMRLAEVAAAALVLVFGLLLLFGYMASERLLPM
jgi:ABC-type nickel/cobalt efflux system permease component RcnA